MKDQLFHYDGQDLKMETPTLKKSALVIFDTDTPQKNDGWWRQFDVIIAPTRFQAPIEERGIIFVDIATLLSPGSVQKAATLLTTLSRTTTSDGQRISELINYKGYELWWTHYSELMYKFCLPYTQYEKLLEHLLQFSRVVLYKPSSSSLFQIFFNASHVRYVIEGESVRRFPSAGTFLQGIISIVFLLPLIVSRPKLMVWTSDLFDSVRDHDFRMRFIYEELQERKIPFVEFIRSLEPVKVILSHAWQRKRPVMYSYAIVILARFFGGLLFEKSDTHLYETYFKREVSSKEKFWCLVALQPIKNTVGDRWAIKSIKLILKLIGIRSAIIDAGTSRNFSEVLACKISGIPIVGILHGASSKYYNMSDFMPEFRGKKTLTVDKYGLWSSWWKEYYLANSRAYKPEQLFVSGPMRPLRQNMKESGLGGRVTEGTTIKVLFVSEQLAAYSEVFPYLKALLENKKYTVYLTFRSYRDNFEEWLQARHPEIFQQIGAGQILRGDIHVSISVCDVVVGSHSTGVLEALLHLKPFVMFVTSKWGDYYGLETFDPEKRVLAESPEELMSKIVASQKISKDILREFQNRFFGDPHQNGSKWVVDQIEQYIRAEKQ